MQQTYEQQIADLKNQITLLKCQAIEADTRNKYTMEKAELDNQVKLAIEEMKQNGENGREAMKLAHDDLKDAQQTNLNVAEDSNV